MSLAYEIVGAVFALLNLMSAYGKLAAQSNSSTSCPLSGAIARAAVPGVVRLPEQWDW